MTLGSFPSSQSSTASPDGVLDAPNAPSYDDTDEALFTLIKPDNVTLLGAIIYPLPC